MSGEEGERQGGGGMTYTKHTRDLADRLGARMRRIYGEDAS